MPIRDQPAFSFEAAVTKVHSLTDCFCHKGFSKLVHVDVLTGPEVQETEWFGLVLMNLDPVPMPSYVGTGKASSYVRKHIKVCLVWYQWPVSLRLVECLGSVQSYFNCTMGNSTSGANELNHHDDSGNTS
jgi:hypothetical protein